MYLCHLRAAPAGSGSTLELWQPNVLVACASDAGNFWSNGNILNFVRLPSGDSTDSASCARVA